MGYKKETTEDDLIMLPDNQETGNGVPVFYGNWNEKRKHDSGEPSV